MGREERNNPRSLWNQKRANKPVLPASTQVASPVSTEQKSFVKASIPAGQDEPFVMELTLKNVWGLFCRMLNRQAPRHLQNHAPTS